MGLLSQRPERDLITFVVAWHKVVRRTWGLSPRSHSAFLPFLLGGHSFCSMSGLVLCFCFFFKSFILIDDPNVLFIARNAYVSAIHNFGKNVCSVCYACNNDTFVASPKPSSQFIMCTCLLCV